LDEQASDTIVNREDATFRAAWRRSPTDYWEREDVGDEG